MLPPSLPPHTWKLLLDILHAAGWLTAGRSRETTRSVQQSEVGGSRRCHRQLPPPLASARQAPSLLPGMPKGPQFPHYAGCCHGNKSPHAVAISQRLKTAAAAAPHVIRQCLARSPWMHWQLLRLCVHSDSLAALNRHAGCIPLLSTCRAGSRQCTWCSGHRKLGISITVPLFAHCTAIYHSFSLFGEALVALSLLAAINLVQQTAGCSQLITNSLPEW
jgi:hypothetical protein